MIYMAFREVCIVILCRSDSELDAYKHNPCNEH